VTLGRKKYCMGCGEAVDTHVFEKDGKRELRCLCCGLTLKFLEDEAPEPMEDATEYLEMVAEEAPDAHSIVIADDSDFLREFMKKLILKKGLAEEVIACVDGQEFITEITKALAKDKRIDLAILDLEMPRMDGVTAARALRAVEAKFETGKKIPILFFSVRQLHK
jgi:CheY-like chemotaxis protein